MCMHDVDLLPNNRQLNYGWPGNNRAFHIASPEYHPRYHYANFIGAILLMTMVDFERVDGMSNKFWGWGREDDELYLRLRQAGIAIARPKGLSSGRNDTFIHRHDAGVRKRDTLRWANQREMSRKRDRLSGVSTLRYAVQGRYALTIKGSACTVVNVKLSCNVSWTPYCAFPTRNQKPAAARSQRKPPP